MENHASNPAGRLWLYFDYLNSQDNQQPVIRLAEKYFDSGTPLSARHMAGVAALMALPDDVETMVNGMKQFPLPQAKLLRPLPKVREYFHADPLGNNAVKWMHNFIDTGIMSDLETTSHILDGFVVQKTDVSEDALQSIKTLAEEILALALADETLDEETRAAIVRHAHRIAEAVDLYKVKGPDALLDELDRFYGSHYRVPSPTSTTLQGMLAKLAATIILAVELVAAPATFANAIEYYHTTFTTRQITEAPAESWDEVIYAVIDDDEEEEAPAPDAAGEVEAEDDEDSPPSA